MIYKKRNVHSKCLKLLEWFPVVVILGARQVGKTSLAKQLGKQWTYLDLEQPEDLDRLSYDPNFFFTENPDSVILDEAQEYPAIFKILRSVIDLNRDKKARFIITGSRGGAEIDIIIDGPFGVLPIEIKYGSTIKRSNLKSLTAFVKDNNLPMGMVINQCEYVEWLTPEIMQVPVGWL